MIRMILSLCRNAALFSSSPIVMAGLVPAIHVVLQIVAV
jgi:hypothetical protein